MRAGRQAQAGERNMLLAGMKVPVREAARRDRPGKGDLHGEDARDLEVPDGRRIDLVETANDLRGQAAVPVTNW
jgi:hypothetical protein